MTVMNSLERMLQILDLFTESRLEWTSEEMAAELGYSRPTLYRYLKTLRDKGLLTSANNANFTLGPKIVEMDYLLRRSDRLIGLGKGILNNLVSKHPATAFICRWYRTHVLCVESACSATAPTSSYPRGRPMPIGRGATSRAILAYLPTRQSDRIIETELEEFAAIGFGASPEEVKAGLKAIRKAGIAIAEGEVTPGVIGFSCPVFEGSRTPVASLSLTLSENTATTDRRIQVEADLRAAAAELSAKLVIASK